MKIQTRLAMERLENRWCPALTASVHGGVLIVRGEADEGPITITQDSTAAGTFTVSDGGTAVGGSFEGVRNIRLGLTEADDEVTIDLGGQTLPGSVSANLGTGVNTLEVFNGEIGGTLVVSSEAGVRMRHRRMHNFFGRPDTDTGLDTVTLAADAAAENVLVRGGAGGSDVTIAGDVAGSLAIEGFTRNGSEAGVTATVSGDVAGYLAFLGSDQDDALTVSGNVGGAIAAATFGGDDTVAIGGAVGGLALDTGADDDTITVSNTVDGPTAVAAGAGDDSVTFEAAAALAASGFVQLGLGSDTVTLDDAATITSLLVNGGLGSDIFNGDTDRDGLRLFGF